ncbi:integrase [Parabacteroides sp. PFB2-10]|uniref:tyrosine-type recombinase/integrase n=1 Tax=Parabacteroides sp. PFB2-10 TaxID=1742405 RepID=UPI0024759E61|nr:site-specific integrase [Parabacteroides sp. PFB2-10]MDH6312494.1 integrase [Parabacteroides sp. PFB2-10]
MAATFILRTDKTEGDATLFVRIQSRTPKINIRVSTGLEVDIEAWNKSLTSAKALTAFRKEEGKGKGKELYQKLDAISALIDSLIAEGIELTTEIVKSRMNDIVYAEQIEAEKKRQQEEAERLAAEQATNLNGFIEQYINECETGKRKKKGGTLNISPGTIKSYKGFKAQFDLYQTERFKVIDFDDVTVEFYNDFRSFLEDKKYSPNTVARMIKILKTICYAAENLKLIDASNIRTGFEVVYRDVDNVYLTEERIQQLYDLDLSNRPAWDKVRDVFVVGCLTGQRVSDYKRINAKMIVRLTDGHDYIKLKQEKTGNIVYIPLDDRVKAIIDKNGGAMPKVHDQKINDYIKDIGEHLKWTETVAIEEQKGSMEYTANKRFCDMLKTHTCRRSLATNMYKAGSSLSSIMAITGHANEQQLKTYLKLNEAEKSMLAMKDKYFTKLKVAK